MTIGMVVDNELIGDARVQNEARTLSKKGFDIKILCLNFGAYPNQEEINGFSVVRKPISKKWKNRLFFFSNFFPFYNMLWAKWIREFALSEKIDILHVHDLYMAVPAIKAKSGLPVIVDLHENFPEAVKGYRWAMKFPQRLFARPFKWKKIERKYLPKINGLVVLSDHFKDDLLSEYPELSKKDWAIYPNVPDVKEFASYPIDHEILKKEDAKIIFYFGGIAARRGIFTTFDALEILVTRGFNVKLLLIGPVDKAELPRFDKYLSNPAIKDHIIHYNWKDISLLPSYIEASDICLSPIVKNAQHESGIANKVFQYMLCSRPVVVSDCRPQKTLVDESGCGLSHLSEDANDMAEKIITLIENPEMRLEMGKSGKKAILAKYNTEEQSQSIAKLYQNLIQG